VSEVGNLRQEIARTVTRAQAPAVPKSPTPIARRPPPFDPAPPRDPSDKPLGRGERQILVAVAQHSDGVTREQLTVLTGHKRSSRDTYLQRLRARGLVTTHATEVYATHAGVAELGDDFEALPTGSALLAHWRGRLPRGERTILEIVVAHWPKAVDREHISEATGFMRSSRDTYLQRLRSRRLVEVDSWGSPKASDMLFDGGAP
jgi:hypothetical protein